MTTRAKRATGGMSAYKLGSIGAQALSLGASYLLVSALFGDSWQAFLGTCVFEFVLVMLKLLVFSGDDRKAVAGYSAIAADTVINGAGAWSAVLNLDNTELWIMLSQALELGNDVSGIPALVIALAVGFVLSIAPHELWRA
jgi:hypothetical protein